MNIIYSFIGKLPNYIIDSIYQCRLYFNDNIYLIIDDLNSEFIEILKNKYNVIIINYDDLIIDDLYITSLKQNFNKFVIDPRLEDRKYLFYRSFERLFLNNILIDKYNLENVLSIELDNLIYDNPYKWLDEFKKTPIAFMELTNKEMCSIGIIYIKDKTSLKELLDYMIIYIKNNLDIYFSEMRSIYKYICINENKETFQLLPNYFKYNNYEKYKSIFDPVSIGQFLCGADLIHTNGKLVLYQDNNCSHIICANHKFKWEEIEGLKKPFIYDEENDNWVLINNLHIHSKHLYLGLSKSIEI
jgi:hypothetical protein